MSAVRTWIVLFRGVGGKTQLPVKPLREALGAAGFGNVATYINSGNASFRSDWSRRQVIATTAAICREAFAFDKAIYALDLAEWRRVIEHNPFPDAVDRPTLLHAAMLAKTPQPDALEKLNALARGGDRIAVVGRVAYLHTPGGFSASKLAERFDKDIGVANTARNWNTVVKLEALAASIGEG